MIRALVATTSDATHAAVLGHARADAELAIVGHARDAAETLQLVRRLHPQLLLLEARAPTLDALAITREIMSESPTPIVILSDGSDNAETELSMHALRAGALAIARLPGAPDDLASAAAWGELLVTAKAMSQVKLVRRWDAVRRPSARPTHIPRCRVVAIAASTGGPAALQRIFAGLPPDFALPILVVQHITDGFVSGFVRWLNSTCALRTKTAEHGEALLPGTIYVAPDRVHLGVTGEGAVALSQAGPIHGFRPSADFMLESVARAFGPACVAVVLSGMGQDALEGARAIRAANGRVLAQDEASSVVFGMNRATIEAGLADAVLPPAAIAQRLLALAAHRGEANGSDPHC